MYTHSHTHRGVLLRNKDEIPSFAATQVDLENIVLNKSDNDKYCIISLIYRILKTQMKLYTKQN